MALASFLKQYKLEKDSKAVITHTGMVCGKYHIPDDELNHVLDVVYKQCYLGGRDEHLVERQRDNGVDIIDLDFRLPADCKKRMHNKAWIDDLLDIYLINIKKIMNVTDKPFKIFVMEKDYVTELTKDKDQTKDGIHIIITINSPHEQKMKLRELVMADSAELMARLPLQNSIDDVFDKALCDGSNGIVLFGCKKPEGRPYKLTYAYECHYCPTDGEPCRVDYPTTVTKETFMELCIRNIDNRTQFPFKSLGLATKQKTQKTNTINTPVTTTTNTNDKWIELLYDVIRNEVNGGQWTVSWNNYYWIAKILKVNGYSVQVLIDWCKLAGDRYKDYMQGETRDMWDGIDIDKYKDNHIHGLKTIAQAINKDGAYEQWLIKHADINPEIVKIIESVVAKRTDYATAVAYETLYKGLQKCVDVKRKEFYCFNEKTKLWEFDVGGTFIRNRLSTEFHDLFEKYKKIKEDEGETFEPKSPEHEAQKKNMKNICGIMRDLQTTNNKNNILYEIGDGCKDVKFASRLNRSQYLIATNDGKVVDMRTLESVDRTIEHSFSYECNAKLIEYDKNDANFILADNYFDELFCGNKETKACVIDILKSAFIGKALHNIYFCIGVGSNGKSLLFKIIKKIFGSFMDVISQNVIIQAKGNKSALNTEIEKLDKCRLGYITELKETDEMNDVVIKQITGGDEIDLRTIGKTNATVTPTCNTFVLTNEFPKFKGDDVAMKRRLIAIPFKKIFPVKGGFEDEMLAISDYIFSYIMHTGNVCVDGFKLSAEMIEEMEKHRKNNTETTLADYLKVRLADCENKKNTDKLISVNAVRVDFERYCADNRLTNTLNARTFPGKLRQLGCIVKESNSQNMLYGKKFITIVVPDVVDVPENDDDGETDGDSGEE